MDDNRKWGAFTIEGGGDRFVNTTRTYLNAIYHQPRGRYLLDEILRLARPRGCENWFWTKCYIRYLGDGCDTDRTGATLASPRITFDPVYITDEREFEPTKSRVVKAGKEHVYLFHECLHVYHILNGTYKGTAWSVKPEEDFCTVGLYGYEDAVLTENAFRYDLKLPRRPCYFWKPGTAQYALETEIRRRLRLPPQRQYQRGGEEERFKKAPPDPPKLPAGSSALEPGHAPAAPVIPIRHAWRAPGPLGAGDHTSQVPHGHPGPLGIG